MGPTYSSEQPEFHVGIDLSLRGTGMLLLNEKYEIIEQELISTNAKQDTEERILEIADKLSFIKNIKNLKTLSIEGLAFGARGQRMLELAALHYYIRIMFYDEKIPFKVIPPTVIKKYLTGKGNSKKDLMLMKAYKKWGVEFEDDNLCDAYCLARYAISQLEEK